MRLLLLAALAGEHILFIGPPGTAKSELGRRLAGLYKGTFFERLLTRFSVPEVRSEPDLSCQNMHSTPKASPQYQNRDLLKAAGMDASCTKLPVGHLHAFSAVKCRHYLQLVPCHG